MGTSAELITPDRGSLHVRDRLDLIERRCAALWSEEPRTRGDREAMYGRLSDLEHRVVALMLRYLGGHDERAIAAETDRCEQDLERLIASWSTPEAA